MYNKDDLNEDIAEYIKDTLEEYGINVVLEEMKWDEYKQRLDGKSYLTACNSRIADYNDPVSFLEIFTSTSAMNDASLGCGDHAKAKIYSIDLTPYGINTTVKNGSWAETYDVLIDAIKNCESESVRYAMMHTAEDMLMDTGFIVPLFYYTDIYMISDSVKGFYRSPMGYKYFMYTSIDQGGE